MQPPIETDIAIIGSGIAGALLAAKLADTGARILIIEAGAPVDRPKALQTFWNAPAKVPESAYPPVPQAMHPTTDKLTEWYCQEGPDLFKSTYLKVVGGTTWHWLGSCPRLLPTDFATNTHYGRGVDWPVSYDTLAPFYTEAEHEIGVSGASEYDLGAPRDTPYPMPPIPQTYLDRVVAHALEGSRFEVRATPQGRNSVMRDQRIACCGSASCIPICPVQAKYDATVHLKKALAAGVQLLDKSTVVKLDSDAAGNIHTAHFRRWDNTPGTVQAKLFVLACHAIETPRLLLASRDATRPEGLANRSGQVGRNLMDHPIQLSWALTNQPVYPYRGPGSTSAIENLRDGAFRRDRSAYRIEIGNEGWVWPEGAPISTAAKFASQGLTGEALNTAIADHASRHIRLASATEQLPHPDNRVTLDPDKQDIYGVPLPHIAYHVDDYTRQGMAQARQDHAEIFDRLGTTLVQHAPDFFGAGHIIGTARMGNDPTTAVVDANLRSHDHPNLYILGASVFPTAGTGNPTLTIAALTLRAAQHISQEWLQA